MMTRKQLEEQKQLEKLRILEEQKLLEEKKLVEEMENTMFSVEKKIIKKWGEDILEFKEKIIGYIYNNNLIEDEPIENARLYNTDFKTNPALTKISYAIFIIIGMFTNKLQNTTKILLKGGKAIQLLASNILPTDITNSQIQYISNDIDIILLSTENKKEIALEIAEFIVWVTSKKDGNNNYHQVIWFINPPPKDGVEIIKVSYYDGKYTALVDITYSEVSREFEYLYRYAPCTTTTSLFKDIQYNYCSQSLDSMLYERLYYIKKLIEEKNEYVLKKMVRSLIFLLFLYYVNRTNNMPTPTIINLYKKLDKIQEIEHFFKSILKNYIIPNYKEAIGEKYIDESEILETILYSIKSYLKDPSKDRNDNMSIYSSTYMSNFIVNEPKSKSNALRESQLYTIDQLNKQYQTLGNYRNDLENKNSSAVTIKAVNDQMNNIDERIKRLRKALNK
jgi:hypothetical protein